MNPVTIGKIGGGAAAVAPLEYTSLSSSEVSDQLRAINATQIQLIGCTIVDRIMYSIGYAYKCRVEWEMSWTKFCAEAANASQTPSLLIDKQKRQDPFPSEQVANEFALTIHKKIVIVITELFSIPAAFIESGWQLQLSEVEPTDFLKETATKVGVALTAEDVLPAYQIRLELDLKSTQAIGQLVFDFTQTSERIEFSRKTFNPDTLEREYSSDENALRKKKRH